VIAQQFRAEFRRLVHRGVLKVFLVTSAVVLVVVGVSTYVATGSEDRYYEHYDDSGYETVERTFCPSSLVTASLEELAYDCPESTPTAIPRQTVFDDAPSAYSPWNGSMAMFTIAFALVLWVLVASLVGEEFRHGTLETALVAEPRRARLLTLRFGAVLSLAVMAWVVMLAGYLVAIAPTWWFHGIDDTTVPVSLVLAAAGRGLVATVLVTLLAASLAVIGRGALTALGVLIGLAIVTAALFLFVHALVPIEFYTNAWAVVTGGDSMRAYTVTDEFYPAAEMTHFGAGWPWSAAVSVIVAYTAAAVAAAYALFMRRDIR
jgi:ABC-type transport system involved in multi-copper enzyme maturation permease subunit